MHNGRPPANVKLSRRARAMYRLRYILGLTHEECARHLGIGRTGASNRDITIRAAFAAEKLAEPQVPGRHALRLPPMRSFFL